MKYIIKRNNNDYVIQADESGNGGYNVVPKEIDPHNKYTIEEIENYLAEHPEHLLNFEQMELDKLSNEIRAERDRRIQKVEWRVARYQHEELLDLPLTEPLLPILEYIQLLRDIPQQEGFPHDVIFPEEI